MDEVTLLRVCLVFSVLLAGGIAYNLLIALLESKHHTEGFLSLLVAGGVLMTLTGVAFIDLQAALLSLAGFVVTGTPMIAGSIYRYLVARKHLRDEYHNGNPTDRA